MMLPAGGMALAQMVNDDFGNGHKEPIELAATAWPFPGGRRISASDYRFGLEPENKSQRMHIFGDFVTAKLKAAKLPFISHQYEFN